MKYIIGSLLFIGLGLGLAYAYFSPLHYPSNDEKHLLTQSTDPQLIQEIQVPAGFRRIKIASGSFGDYLRNLPLKPNATVYLYNGEKKHNQQAQYAVLAIDVGKKNLQQCADAVMRLRAEYLFQKKAYSNIQFHFTSGDLASYNRWREGYRAQVKGNKVRWVKSNRYDASYKNFRRYLETVFMYAGSYSLAKELKNVRNIQNLQIGDVFIQGGFPGHAVLVVDVARHSRTGELLFLLAQSYMPAQDIHILKNPNNGKLNPWYSSAQVQDKLVTPEWTFKKNNLKRF